jgi:alpha-glucosidase
MQASAPSYLSSIHHDGSPRYVHKPGGNGLRVGDDVTIRLRAAINAPIERVLLRTCPDGEQSLVEMQPEDARTGACRWWHATLRLAMPLTGYRFLVFAADGVWWVSASGPHSGVPTDAEDFRLLAGYSAPAWVRESVFYQIFPDRFADGDRLSNVRNGEFDSHGVRSRARSWGDPPAGFPGALVEFYGGDLPGVEEHLDYLADLGVNAIYFNPVFTAYSNHRYDVVDYFHVDPHLGGDEALVSLRRATRERGLRFILDIVPNHCGVAHPWFQAALGDPSAPTAGFFTFHRHPDDYECWLGVRALPKLNYRSRALRDVMYSGRESVFRYWLREPYAIDGWRVDVANMLARHGPDQLERDVWLGIRAAVKDENQQAYLLGENFFDGSPQLQGDSLDATMNYAGFTKPVLYWLNRFEVDQHGEPHHVAFVVPWPTQALVDSWQSYRAAIPWEVATQQFNLLGSHDTARILSLVAGDPARNRLAVALLMTYVGVPCIYYGDEIGMRADDSLQARNCMLWDPSLWDSELRAFYQALVKLRRTSPALIEGGFQVLLVEEDTVAYMRDAEEEQVILVGNRGPGTRPAGPLPLAQAAIPDGTEFEELFTGQRLTVLNGGLPLPALFPGVQVWRTIGV